VTGAPAVRLVFTRLLLLASVACGKTQGDASSAAPAGSGAVAIAPKGEVLEAAENEAAPDAGAKPRAAAPKAAAGEKSEIPGGKLVSGSTPGDKGRDPVLEPALAPVDLGAFSIDRYLYPNDPAKPPMTGVSRNKAMDLCHQAGGRLCTELEWERACKGDGNTAYAGGDAWDPACAQAPAACASTLGPLGLGAALREWTASDVEPVEKLVPRAASVRGARADAAAVDHRCARRAAVDATTSGDDIGFRCCYGPPNAATIPSPKWAETFRRAELSPAQASEMFATVRELNDLARDITFFKEPDDANLVLARGDAGGPPPNTTLTTQPLLWSPVPGEEILVVAGKAKKDAFIVAFYRLPGQRYRIASSMILKDERGPVVLAHNAYVRKKLLWSTGCFDCRAESGFVTYRDDNRIVITQK
jgi:formylglycine-generating enzyme required for sulfatase activity